MSETAAAQATDPNEIRRQLLDWNVPKSEREWWAARHIRQIETEKEGLAKLLNLSRNSASEWQAQAERGITMTNAKNCLSLVRGGNADKTTAELLEFMAERLVNQYGESPNVDFVHACRTRAKMLRDAERILTPSPPH